MLISVIIPCYNSSRTIKTIVNNVIFEISKESLYSCEIILINDSSLDNTLDILIELSDEYENVQCLDFAKNFGQHAALMAGFRIAEGDIVLCMDDDGQTDPKELFKLVNSLNENTDVVYAKYTEKQHSFFRNIFSRINDKMACVLLGKNKDLYVSSYFVMKRYVVDEITKYENSFPYVLGLVLRTTNKIGNVGVIHNERINGKSGYTLKKLLGLWINGFTSFSATPLRIATLFGFVFGLLGFVFSIYVILNKIFNPNIAAGWSSLISVIFITSGVILFVIGLMGEYIGRCFISINKAPQYVIRKQFNNKRMKDNDKR